MVETEEEESWWSIASPWLHGGLDVLGLVPGLGAVPDLVNAGIYAIEGDLTNAGLSATAAIPFAGDAVKGGIMIAKNASKSARASTHAAPPAPHISNQTTPPPPNSSGGSVSQRQATRPSRPRGPRKYERKVVHEDGSVTYTLKTKSGKNVDVTYKNGYPDFSKYRYQGSLGDSQVTIKMSGDKTDFAKANLEAGFGKGQYSHPKGYTWHHHEDGKTMQLIRTNVHDAAPHTGGASITRNRRQQ